MCTVKPACAATNPALVERWPASSICSIRIWLAIVAVAFSLIGAFYYLRVVKLMYFDNPADEVPLAASADMRLLISVNVAALTLVPNRHVDGGQHLSLGVLSLRRIHQLLRRRPFASLGRPLGGDAAGRAVVRGGGSL